MRLRFTKLALADIEHARRYLTEKAGEDTAESQLKRVDATLARLLIFPESAPRGRIDGTRELVVLKTPFIVPYRVTGSDIEVLVVMHHARKWPEVL